MNKWISTEVSGLNNERILSSNLRHSPCDRVSFPKPSAVARTEQGSRHASRSAAGQDLRNSQFRSSRESSVASLRWRALNLKLGEA